MGDDMESVQEMEGAAGKVGGVVWDDFLQEVTLELSLEADWVKRDKAFLAEQELLGTGEHTCVAAAGGGAGCWARDRLLDAAASVSQGQADKTETVKPADRQLPFLLIDFKLLGADARVSV